VEVVHRFQTERLLEKQTLATTAFITGVDTSTRSNASMPEFESESVSAEAQTAEVVKPKSDVTATLNHRSARVYRSGMVWQACSFRHGERHNLGIHPTKYEALEAVARYEIRQGRGRYAVKTVRGPDGNDISYGIPLEPPPIVVDPGSYRDSKGVYVSGDMWVAQSTKNDSWQYLGRHETIEAAAQAVKNYEAGVDPAQVNQSIGATSHPLKRPRLANPRSTGTFQQPENVHLHDRCAESQSGATMILQVQENQWQFEERRGVVVKRKRGRPRLNPIEHKSKPEPEQDLEAPAPILGANVDNEPEEQFFMEPDIIRTQNKRGRKPGSKNNNNMKSAFSQPDSNSGAPQGFMHEATETDDSARHEHASFEGGLVKKWSARVFRGGVRRQIGLLETKDDALEAVAMFKEYEAETDSDDDDVPGVFRIGRRWKAVAFHSIEAKGKVKVPEHPADDDNFFAFDLGLWDMKSQAISALNIFKSRCNVVYGAEADLSADVLASFRSVEPSATGYKGICLRGNKFQARYRRNRKEYYVGNYDSVMEAIKAIMQHKDDPKGPAFVGMSIAEVLRTIGEEISVDSFMPSDKDDVNSKIIKRGKREFEVKATSATVSQLEEAVKLAINYQHRHREPELPEEHEVAEVMVEDA